METLLHGIKACSTLRSCSPIEGSTYKPRRRRGITRNTKKTGVATSRLQRNTAQFLHGSITRMKIDVIVQICELPFKTGGIRQYAYFILIKMRHTTYNFQHNLTPRRFTDTPMYYRCLFQSYNTYRRKGCLHLVNSGKLRQQPLRHLKVCQCPLVLCSIIRLISPIMRKEK